MPDDTFISNGISYKLSVNPAPSDGSRYPIVILVHGNFGLGAPYGDQIRGFAKNLAGLGYLTAVPQFYSDDNPHVTDTTPFVQALRDAVAAVARRPDADADRLGLIGFSLGATTAMTYVASSALGAVKVLADFFGFLTSDIRTGISKFPPTIILHNKNDHIVDVQNSVELDHLLTPAINHEFVTPYDESWQEVNHSFKPGGTADIDSRTKSTAWFVKNMPPVGR